MEKGRERFFHPDRGTAAPDVSGRRKQLPDGNQIGFLVARNAGGSFQIDLVISRDDTDEMARPVTTKHERLENRSNIFAELFGHVSRGQMLLIHPIRDQFVGDFGSVEQTGRIGLSILTFPCFIPQKVVPSGSAKIIIFDSPVKSLYFWVYLYFRKIRNDIPERLR